MQQEMTFDGATYNHERDNKRLSLQMQSVYDMMSDEQWYSVPELAKHITGSETSISTCVRNFRKERFGGHNVERRYVSNGLFEYKLHLKKG